MEALELERIGVENQRARTAVETTEYETMLRTVRAFMAAHGLQGKIDEIDLDGKRLPARELHIQSPSQEDINAWDEATRPMQLEAYNGLRNHPVQLPITDAESYLLVRNSNAPDVIGGLAPAAPEAVIPGWTLWVRYFPQGRTVKAFPPSDKDLFPGRGNSFLIPHRHGPKPETSSVVPHLQMTDCSPPAIREAMLEWMRTNPEFAGCKIAPSEVAEPTSVALFLAPGMYSTKSSPLSPIMRESGYEAFHMHEDGGWHVSLSREDEWEVMVKRWGETHPAARWGINVLLIYAPRDTQEMEVIKKIMTASFRYAKGQI